MPRAPAPPVLQAEEPQDEEFIMEWMLKHKNIRKKAESKKRFRKTMNHFFMVLVVLYCAVASWLTLTYALKFDLEAREQYERLMEMQHHASVNNATLRDNHNGTLSADLPVAYALSHRLLGNGLEGMGNFNFTNSSINATMEMRAFQPLDLNGT